MTNPDEAVKRAQKYFWDGASCAEAVLHVLQEELDLPENIIDGAIGLGGGIGRCQSLCGTISGAAVALSHRVAANTSSTAEARPIVRALAQELYQSFVAKFGHAECRDLVDADFLAPGGYEAFHQRDLERGEKYCNAYLEHVIRTVLAIAP
jgi:C_GCAxxG_C_C family probable redox protein